MLGMHGTIEANNAMQNCDVLLAVGARFDDRVIGNPKHFAQNERKIIHIDIDPSSISKRVKVDIPIVGDVKDVLNELIAMGKESNAKPDSDVFCVTGEGSIQMCIQELSTCLQYKTPVKIVSLNNRYLGMVRQWQQLDYGGRYSHSYMDALPDFVKLAEAYGHVGLLIEKPGDVEGALREAIKLKDRTVFLDFRTDPTENVWPMVQAGKGISEMLLGSEDL